MDFTFPARHRIEIKESEKLEKYQDLAKELERKFWNVKVRVMSIIIWIHGTLAKNLEKIMGKLEI